MKKRILLFSSVALTVGALVFLVLTPKASSENNENDSVSPNRNQTIEIYKEKLAGKSEEEVNAYFAPFTDDKTIIADKSGGFTSSLTDDYDEPVETLYPDGTRVVQSFHDENVAATIAQVKQALREEREEN